MRKRYLLLVGASLMGAMTLSPAVTSQAIAQNGAPGTEIAKSPQKPAPQSRRQYNRGYRRGSWDADNNCRWRDVSWRSYDYRNGWEDGFSDGGC